MSFFTIWETGKYNIKVSAPGKGLVAGLSHGGRQEAEAEEQKREGTCFHKERLAIINQFL